jgi:hypothetical protein
MCEYGWGTEELLDLQEVFLVTRRENHCSSNFAIYPGFETVSLLAILHEVWELFKA